MNAAVLRTHLAVGAGAALGALARYLCSVFVLASGTTLLLLATLTVNVMGSFFIGWYARASLSDGSHPASPVRRHFVITGFCGGFTTFSLFSLEATLLVGRGFVAGAAAYVALSLLLWLLAVVAGARLAERRAQQIRSHTD